MEPKYYSLSYGPAFDRDYLHLVSEEKKDLSQGRSFSRIMQQAINGTEGEVVVESSYQGTYSCWLLHSMMEMSNM